MEVDAAFTCPCCGFLVFDEAPGSYDICPLCGWEDDHVQLAHPAMRGGANGESLYEAQQRALNDFPMHVQLSDGYRRDPRWRPLRPEDLVAASTPQTGKDYFFSAVLETPEYYWLIPAAPPQGQ